LIELSVLPSWVALVILCREFIVSGIRMVAASQGVVIAASWYGKAKTVTQIIAIVLFLIKDSHVVSSISAVFEDKLYLISWAVMIVALILTIISMLDYFVKAKELLGFTRSATESHGRAAGGSSDGVKPQASAEAKGTQELDREIAVLLEPCALEDLARDVLSYAQQTGKSLGTAESCTGGLIAATLTSLPGSSESVAGGIVSYSNDVKHNELGVGRETLELFGAVSEQTAVQMARGARKQLDVDIAVSVTGIAGPGGATPDKPVGTVWIGLADAGIVFSQLCHFAGNREQVRLQTVRTALELIRDVLRGNADEHRVENS
ncbi:MAG: CinA family protein, partial [Raoultibacter sp.]